MTIEKLKDKLHDKIEIHVCEVEENTLIAQGMLKALGMMDEVLEKAEQEPCDDAVSRQAVLDCATLITSIPTEDWDIGDWVCLFRDRVGQLPSVRPQEPKTGQYEKHIDHTDCIWYGSDSGCPVTCSQYRDGWNDAMDYIFKNGKGYQPYRHEPQESEE